MANLISPYSEESDGLGQERRRMAEASALISIQPIKKATAEAADSGATAPFVVENLS
ncbi:MAG: hypothetical protein PHF70_02480 [Opitutales bacterium]|nr:hypothetical protein [Opitutales bacterium]